MQDSQCKELGFIMTPLCPPRQFFGRFIYEKLKVCLRRSQGRRSDYESTKCYIQDRLFPICWTYLNKLG